MTHDEFDAAIDAHLAGGLSADERPAFERHVKACEPCAKNLAAAREFTRFVSGALEPNGPAEDLDERILSALRAEGFRGRRRLRLPPVPRFVRAAAAAAFAIAVGAAASMPPETLRGMPAKDATGGITEDYRSLKSGEEDRGSVEDSKGSGEMGSGGRNLTIKGGGSRSSSSPSRSENEWMLEQSAQVNDKLDFGGGAGGGGAAGSAAPEAAARKVIRTGSLEIEVASFDAAHRAVVAVLQELGGFVASANTQKLANGRIRGTITVRFPAGSFDAATLRFKELGEVKNQSVSTQDVTRLFFDTEANLRNKKILEERLLEILKKSKGNVKELLEVEKELGTVRAEIERLEGEMKYLANQVSLSTLTLNLHEKDIGQPFEYVLTQEAQVQLVTMDVPAAYERAQETLRAAGGVILARDLRQMGQDSAYATVQARIDVERFSGTVEVLKKLGEAAQATVSQNQRAVGGNPEKAGADAPVRKEMATVNLAIQTPPEAVTVRAEIRIEAADARAVHETARGILSGAQGKVTGGGFSRTADGEQGTLAAELPPAALHEAVARLKELGTVKASSLNQEEPSDKATLRREKGIVTLTVRTPPAIVTEETGPAALFRKTLAGSIAGVVWSVRMLFVGAAYLGPWALLIWGLWKLARRGRKAT